jgi:YegS/Rv2252/BmrU family lipid kinase
MRRAGLIINPKAGRGSSVDARLDEMIRVFSKYGFEADIRRTTPEPDSARDLAVRASESCDTVIACGGDGTVHGVLQGIAGTSTRLGVIPFGTANALARNLSLPSDPVLALDRLLSFTAKQIPLGKAATLTSTRWFTVMAGAGPDGTLVQEMKLAAKARVGRSAYYTEAARLFLTRRFPQFRVEYRLLGSTIWENRLAVGMMASRVQDLGGLFSGLTSNSRLHHPHLLVQLLAAPAHLAFPAWMSFGKVGLGKANPWLTTLEVEELRCVPFQEERQVFAQVDGEAVGVLPIKIQVVPSSLHLLMP